MKPKPKDCTCGFPKVEHTRPHGHAEWCSSFKRLSEKAERRYLERYEAEMWAAKDAYGRAMANGEDWDEDW
jgi:hypothetical protein